MVGLNYRLRGRESLPRKSKNKTDEAEEDREDHYVEQGMTESNFGFEYASIYSAYKTHLNNHNSQV